MARNLFSRLSQALKKDKTVRTEAAPAFGIGTMIGNRYRLEGELGRGGMGIVFRAYDTQNSQDVAIKIINLDLANALSRQQFSREAEITLRLKHPHIVAVYETGTVDTGRREHAPYIVMELVRGAGLDTMHGFTYARIIDIAKQICEALEYAHEQGFVHRDLKPANVLIEKHGFQLTAKLMDFGLARQRGISKLPYESNMAGTIYYLAPEVIAGQPPDVSADLYALGAMLYEMVTGHVPFSDFIDDQAILAQHLSESVAPPSQSRADVPPALESIVLRLLEKDPKDRFASAQEVRLALEQLIRTSETGTVRSNLPKLPPDFGGHENEIAEITQLFESSQLVTLLDDNGTLALAAAHSLSAQFTNGVWLVELNALTDPSLVLPAAAATLGVTKETQHALTVSLIEHLREKNMLLLLNHCDHVRGACARLIETILRTCPEVRILAISDQPLNIPDEKCLPR